MRGLATAALIGAGLVGYASAQAIGTACDVGSPNVCLNSNVVSLADADANIVLVCVNGFYTASVCAAGEGCQNGVCVNLLTPSGIVSVSQPSAAPSNAATAGVGVPCIVGTSPDVCLNPNVASLTDANANVLLTCVDGFYATTICIAGEVCQGGVCVVLNSPSGAVSSAPAPIISGPSAGITIGISVGPGDVSSGIVSLPSNVPSGFISSFPAIASSAPNTATQDAIGRSLASVASALSAASANPTAPPSSGAPTGTTDPDARSVPSSGSLTGDVDPNGRGRTTVTTTASVPVFIIATEYITISQCLNGQCEYATWCNMYPVCDSCAKPPQYQYKTTYLPGSQCLQPGCREEINTLVYPYCDVCDAATECVVTTTPGCACTESTITVVPGKTTKGSTVKTATITQSTTINYPAPATVACSTCGPAATTPAAQTTVPTPQVFISAASAGNGNVFAGPLLFFSFVAMLIAM